MCECFCSVYLITQTSQIDYFHRVHTILRWIGFSDFKYRPGTFAITLLSPLGKGPGPLFEQTWIPLIKVWLKLTQWFWSKRFKYEKFTERQTDGRQAISKKITALCSGDVISHPDFLRFFLQIQKYFKLTIMEHKSLILILCSTKHGRMWIRFCKTNCTLRLSDTKKIYQKVVAWLSKFWLKRSK